MTKNVQIKVRNNENNFDDIFPKTKVELVDGLEPILENKVEKVSGKQLSTNDFTAVEKDKLLGMETGANKYTHPTTHPASIITESATKRFVTDTEKSTWNGKQNNLGFTPESVDNKGKAGGYSELDSNAKIPVDRLPDLAKSQTYVVTGATDRGKITGMIAGDKAYETDTGDSFIYNGTVWLVLAKADWENVNLQWSNIVKKPSSSADNIDDAVSKKHDHSNKGTLDKIKASGVQVDFDLSKFVTQSELGNAGYGDMTKSVYDKNGNGVVDNAEKVNGFTVDINVPGNAKFTDTVYTHPTTHPASIITENSSKRFVSDTEKGSWNDKTKVAISSTVPANDVGIWFQEV